jgi:hypothetical protein
MAEIPDFNIDEIQGEFDTDQHGNYLIIKTKNGKLQDKYGRIVNRRGYLIDTSGNIITRGGIFVFYHDEISPDDEIPAPYSLDKAIQSKSFKVQSFSEYRKQAKLNKLAMQDEFIEREYQRLKNESIVQMRAQ